MITMMLKDAIVTVIEDNNGQEGDFLYVILNIGIV
jgi:hypothetical protein